eukprot:767365-Hanusia_phi.AAC.4
MKHLSIESIVKHAIVMMYAKSKAMTLAWQGSHSKGCGGWGDRRTEVMKCKREKGDLSFASAYVEGEWHFGLENKE